MLNKQKFAQIGKLLVLGTLAVSLSGCYLSLGGGGKKKRGDDGDNIVVTTGGQAAPPVIINNTQPAPAVHHQTEQTLRPVN